MKNHIEPIIGVSENIETILKQTEEASKHDHHVLIYGPTGTGKELIANNIHFKSKRKRKVFERLNCGAFPTDLFESEFFGHKKGSFTGANEDKKGKVEIANEGTLFLDEVGDLKPNHQVKILRFLESGEYTPIGSAKTKRANVRIVAATNKDPQKAIRKDLYYRLNQFFIETKALYPWMEDIICLVNHFRQGSYIAKDEGKKQFLLYCNYPFPGNARELKNLMLSQNDYKKVGEHIASFWDKEIKTVINPDFNLDEYPLYSPHSYFPDEVINIYSPKESKELKNRGGNYIDYNSYVKIQDVHDHTKREIIRGIIRANKKDFENAYKLLEDNSFEPKKWVRCFEIYILLKANLGVDIINKILKISKSKITAKGFKSTYGFEIPEGDYSSPLELYNSERPQGIKPR